MPAVKTLFRKQLLAWGRPVARADTDNRLFPFSAVSQTAGVQLCNQELSGVLKEPPYLDLPDQHLNTTRELR